jgi:hypothetical protein
MRVELEIRRALSMCLSEFISYKLSKIEDKEIVKDISILLGVNK